MGETRAVDPSETGSLLIVDDDPIVRESLRKWLREEGYEVGIAASAHQALKQMARHRWDLALVDMRMRGTEGIELQRRLREVDPALLAIVMAGYASLGTASVALKAGAYDYVIKPVHPDLIAHTVRHALAHRRAERENLRLREAVAAVARPQELIGQSAAMKRVVEAIETVAPTEATVLISGEVGTGKELVARVIHRASPRRFNPFVVIHFGAPVRTRLESEFFADEDVPFNGEQHRRRDSLEIANGGTVFLDGVAGISLRTQARLLPLLEEREIRRGDGKRPDIRFVAATCNDLEGLIDEGRLRPDFATRLNVFQIALPPLRERKEDIPLLVEHFIRKCAAAMNKKMAQVSTRTMNLLQRCNWPGNVRELENAVERAMVAAQSPELREEDFALRLPYPVSTARTWEEAERNHILRILEECAGSQKRAAEVLAINRTTLHNKLKSYGWKKTRAKTDS